MIPPITPGQSDIKQNMVGWKNTFNMRQITLLNLASSNMGIKNGARISGQSQKRTFGITNVSKSLELLRMNLQTAINKDIDNIIKKYLDKFFQPALINIKNNLGQDSVTEQNIRDVCKEILEQAKSMYVAPIKQVEYSTYDYSKSEADSESNPCEVTYTNIEKTNHPLHPTLKRKEADLDIDNLSCPVMIKRNKPKLLSNYYNDNLGCKFSLKRDGPKWNPERIKRYTSFIMGSRANKVLGYGQTRGRLYVRHPNLLRYCGDQEDKEWLQSQNLLPANGGKIYIMLLEDIKELTESDEYKNNPNLQLHELQGFEAPEFMNAKIKNFLEYIKTEKKLMAVLDVDDHDAEGPPPNVTITNETVLAHPGDRVDRNIWRTSQLRQQIDYPNMSSDMSSLSSSVISSILAGTYTHINTMKNSK
ncbi:deoxynucleotidyltransferase terminal-interacting protein 1 [Euwallacea similis]|uniref:deoxynucleotidyltransferase terminal-interacting protein 1 n=1 Tax=Euwallacea similis TaxID=1736056 RepID=UPI003450C993